jgi:hypothetical protein
MTAEKITNTIENEKRCFSADLDAYKFTGLYVIATGEFPSREKVEFLRDFTQLSLEQASGGFDAIVDDLASGRDSKHSQIVRAYWEPSQVEKYRLLLEKVDQVYKEDERRPVKVSMASWYATFHHQESETRGVKPATKQKEEFRSSAEDPNVKYREVTNKAYASTMLEIVNPSSSEAERKENEELLDGVMYPVLMVYQTITDHAQAGLECQESKCTMDKAGGEDFGGLPTIERIRKLTRSAREQSELYTQQIEFPVNLTPFSLREKFVRGVAWLDYCKEVLRYQIRGSDEGRYKQSI